MDTPKDILELLRLYWWIIVPLFSGLMWLLKRVRAYGDLNLVGEFQDTPKSGENANPPRGLIAEIRESLYGKGREGGPVTE